MATNLAATNAAPDYFALFGLEADFALDGELLAERYRELQRRYHPDRFAGKAAQDVRLAVRMASLVNQAYEVLKVPVKRALYLLELAGVEVGHHVTADGAFLMQQMAMRDDLAEVEASADPFAALEQLATTARASFASLEQAFATALAAKDYPKAVEAVAKMQFFAKFLADIDAMEEHLEN